MRRKTFSLTFVFAALLLLSRPAHASDWCIEPGFWSGVTDAELIFSGKIAKVERVETAHAAGQDYIVTFKVERWWKGTPASTPRVLWRSSSLNCPSPPVGEVGDDYLVYADPSRSTRGDKTPEVTTLNRTARLPASTKADRIVKSGFSVTEINRNPPLNRGDASNDIDLLLAMRECGCLTPPSSVPVEASAEQTQRASECLVCLRRSLKQF